MTAEAQSFRPLQVTPEEFLLFQKFVYEGAGIWLSNAKQALLSSRLASRLRELGLSSFGEYFEHLAKGGEAERQRFFDAITTNETRFFREPGQFEFLVQSILPTWMKGSRGSRIRCWSAGCSSGEEPYSVAMAVLAAASQRESRVSVLATDLSTRALGRAVRAEFSIDRAEEIPSPYLRHYMLRGEKSKAGLMKPVPEVRNAVEFRRLNLNEPIELNGPPFDLIFCRNVLIYFDLTSKRRVLEQLLRHLAPEGYLFLGHAESITGWNRALVPVRPSIYCYVPE